MTSLALSCHLIPDLHRRQPCASRSAAGCCCPVALAALVPACSKAAETAPTAVYVQAAHPEKGEISEQITADATLAPLAQAAISPKVTAPVKKFYVQRGSRVKAGQLLASLENQDLQAAALDNKGAYSAAQGTYDIATGATVPEDTVKAQSDLTQATANLNLAQSIVDSRTQLFAEGAIPGRDLDTAKASLVQAKAAHEIAKQHFEAVQKISHKAALESAARPTHFGQGQVSRRPGPAELYGDSQPHFRCGDRPASVRRGNGRCRQPGDYRNGYVCAPGQAAPLPAASTTAFGGGGSHHNRSRAGRSGAG